MAKTWIGNGVVQSLCEDGLQVACTETYTHAGAHVIAWNAAATSLTDSIAQAASGVGYKRTIGGQQGASGSAGGIVEIQAPSGGVGGTDATGTIRLNLSPQCSPKSGIAQLIYVGTTAWLQAYYSTAVGVSLEFADDAHFINASHDNYLRADGVGKHNYFVSDNAVFMDHSQAIWRTFGNAAAYTDTLAIGCTSFVQSQVDNTTASATGAPRTIRAQNATGTTATGGTLFLSGGTGTTAGGNVCLGATSFTANGMGTGLFIATATGTPTAAPSGGVYCFAASSGVLRVADSGSTGGRIEDIHASFKADQTVAFTPTAVAKFKRSGSAKFTSAVTRTVVQIEAAAIPSGGSIVSVGRLTIKVTAFDSTAGGVYVATWQSGYKSIAGTLSVETAVLMGTAIDNTSTDVTGVTTVLNSGAIDVKFVTLKTDPIYVLIEVEVDGMRIS